MHQEMPKNEAFKQLNVPANILQRLDDVLSLSLFEGLDDDSLANLLSVSHIQSYEEGKQLLTLGETATHLYAILSGSAKTFCNTEDGRESIVSLAFKDDFMLENSIVFNKPASVSCSVLEEGEFLVMPAADVRRLIQSNAQFSNNLLMSLAEKNNNMIFKFSEVTLQTAVHRVGSFLLRTKLDAEAPGTTFKLQCEKSQIAGYLGMTPETFSRALSKLRDEGIDVQKHQVVIEHHQSLCEYHNTAYDFKCENWKTPKCPKYYG